MGVETMRFGEFTATLPPRCSLNSVNALTLQGVVLFVLQSRLISLFVDGFFGGNSEGESDNALGELTVSEMRISRMIIRAAAKDLKLSWEQVYKLDLDEKIETTNPYFLNMASPTELIASARLKIEIGSHQGEMLIAMPYSVIEPIKDLLETGTHSDRNSKFSHWQNQLKGTLREVRLGLKANLVETSISLADVLTLRPGDVIPVDVPEQVALCVEGIPMFRGAYGISRGRNSIMLTQAQGCCEGLARAPAQGGKERLTAMPSGD
jgi:flagellar motor switch protein FliM